MDGFSKPADIRHTTFSTKKIRKILFVAEKASRAVHSNAHMSTPDRKNVLGMLASIKRECESLLQLELLTDAQRE